MSLRLHQQTLLSFCQQHASGLARRLDTIKELLKTIHSMRSRCMDPIGRAGQETSHIRCHSAKLWPCQRACSKQPYVMLRSCAKIQAHMAPTAATSKQRYVGPAHSTPTSSARCLGTLWTPGRHSSRAPVLTAAAAQPQPPPTNEDEQQQPSSSSEAPRGSQHQQQQKGTCSRPRSGSSSETRSPFSIDDPQLLVGDCVALVAAALYR